KTSRSTILILDISGQYNGAETQEHKSESVKFRIRMRDAGWQRHEAVGLFPRGRPECGEGLQGFGVVGPEFECAGIFLESLVALVLPCEHAAEVVMAVGLSGFACNAFLNQTAAPSRSPPAAIRFPRWRRELLRAARAGRNVPGLSWAALVSSCVASSRRSLRASTIPSS